MFKWLRSWKNIAMNQWTDNFIASPQNQQIKWFGVIFDFNQIWFGRRYFFYSKSYLSFPCEQILSWKEGGGCNYAVVSEKQFFYVWTSFKQIAQTIK